MSARPRRVLLVAHTGREAARQAAQQAAGQLLAAGVAVVAPAQTVEAVGVPGVTGVDLPALDDVDGAVVGSAPADAVEPATDGPAAVDPALADLVVVLGGDGTLLRAAALVASAGIPLIGVNLGHVGFLAEAEPDALQVTLGHIVEGRFDVEERLALDIAVRGSAGADRRAWALNEVAVEKADRARMLDCVVEVDRRPVSRWGCDGVVVATPTGSTAYAFSAGGPVIWPAVQALLVVPISAHALFNRPLVVPPTAVVAVEVLSSGSTGVVSCDGRRLCELPAHARVEVRRAAGPVRLARLHDVPFTDRLVAKFALPVEGWRGRAETRLRDAGTTGSDGRRLGDPQPGDPGPTTGVGRAAAGAPLGSP